jgi:hypothetical protein
MGQGSMACCPFLPFPLLQRRVMHASLQKISDNCKINPNNEHPIHCPYGSQQYLLIWDDKEWNSVKDWIRLAEAAVRKSHRAHGEIALPTTLKVPPTSARWAYLFYQNGSRSTVPKTSQSSQGCGPEGEPNAEFGNAITQLCTARPQIFTEIE